MTRTSKTRTCTTRALARPLLAALAVGLLASAAQAQNPAAPLRSQDTDPAMPPASQTPPDRVRPSADAPPRDQSLSDKLRRDDGVIKPPADGAAGTVIKPEAGAGTMPVIKPGELPGRQPGTEAR